jgi:hypothetical protein
MMEAANMSEMAVNFYQATRRYNPEDSHLWNGTFTCIHKKKKFLEKLMAPTFLQRFQAIWGVGGLAICLLIYFSVSFPAIQIPYTLYLSV